MIMNNERNDESINNIEERKTIMKMKINNEESNERRK